MQYGSLITFSLRAMSARVLY